MIDRLRSRAYQALTSPAGDRLAAIRAVKEAARKANDLVGRPLAPADELFDRREFERRYGAGGRPDERPSEAPSPARAESAREAAPVVVYHAAKHRAPLRKITEILDARAIPYQVLDIEDDPAAQAAVKRDGKGWGLPIVFVAGVAVGGVIQVANLDANGELAKLVWA
jgi:glutaredoxin